MKTQTITVTQAVLDTTNDYLYDCGLITTSTGQYFDKAYPQAVVFTNNSDVSVQVTFLTLEEKIKEYGTYPTRFVGIEIPTGTTFRSWEYYGTPEMRGLEWLKIKGVTSGSTSDITVYLLNFE